MLIAITEKYLRSDCLKREQFFSFYNLSIALGTGKKQHSITQLPIAITNYQIIFVQRLLNCH